MFELKKRDSLARICTFEVRGRKVETPSLMPVINPHLIVISPREMMEKFGVGSIITNGYIIYRSPKRDEFLERGIHSVYDFDGVVMTDSGTFQQYMYGDVEIDNRTTVEFQTSIGSDIVTVLDDFTVPEATKDEASKAVVSTLKSISDAKSMANDRVLATPVQGGVYPELREMAAREISNLGTEYAPIGGVVPLMESYQYSRLVEIIIAVKKGLEPAVPVHLFGAGHPMFFSMAVLLGVDFFDSAAYVKYAKEDRLLFSDGTRHLENLAYIPEYSPELDKYTPDEIREMDKDERFGVLSRHNLYVSVKEIERIKQHISENTMWDYVEERSHSHPELYRAYRTLLRHSEFLMKYENLSRKRGFFLTSEDSLRRPAVKRMKENIKSCRLYCKEPVDIEHEGRRPFTRYTDKRCAVVKDVFGYVPIELEEIYPIGPCVVSGEAVLKEKHTQFPVDEETIIDNYDLRKIVMVADYQFGPGAGRALFLGEKVKITKSRKTGKIRDIVSKNGIIATMRASDGFFTLNLEGAMRLHALEYPRNRVVVNSEVSAFIRDGKNVFAKFVVDADDRIVPYSEVIIVDEDDNILGVGKTLMNREEMLSFTRGVAVDTRRGVKNV